MATLKIDKQLIADRLKELMKASGLTSGKELGAALGYKRPDNIYNVLNAENAPGIALLADLSNKFESLNVGWLLGGEGPMFFNSALPKQEKAGPALISKEETFLLDLYASLDRKAQRTVIELLMDLRDKQRDNSGKKGR